MNTAVIQRWRDSNKLTWHHYQDMQTMQLVKQNAHDLSKHTGGQSYAASVTQELIVRGLMTDKRQGLDSDLIRQARELGLIPADYLW
ncbi:MAG: HNH endonuclease [Bacteroidales bacterium]|nr:HNH endonuclease [Bacteroidales bacterium]